MLERRVVLDYRGDDICQIVSSLFPLPSAACVSVSQGYAQQRSSGWKRAGPAAASPETRRRRLTEQTIGRIRSSEWRFPLFFRNNILTDLLHSQCFIQFFL